MCCVVGFLDLYFGCGYLVGVVFFFVGCFYLVLVGNDIGCGMVLWEIGLVFGKLLVDKLEKCLGNFDLLLDEIWSDCIEVLDLLVCEYWCVFGMIGGGNYFVELQQVEIVFDQVVLYVFGFDVGCL